jgi:hypothetical protein
MLPLEEESLCQFMKSIIKIKHMDTNILPLQAKIASQDKH